MKTYTLIITLFAICVIQGIIAEEIMMKCNGDCFNGCKRGVCKKTKECNGCSRKYFEDKESVKEKIKLMKKNTEEKIEEVKSENNEEMEELIKKHEKEMTELTQSHTESHENLVKKLQVDLQEVIEGQKRQLLAMRNKHADEVKELKEKQSEEINEMKEEHENKVKKTVIALKAANDKKKKALETICHGDSCPCCSETKWDINCNFDC